jgi:hypothetical protein
MLAEQVDLQPDASASLDEEALALRGQSAAQPVSRDGRCALGRKHAPGTSDRPRLHDQYVAPQGAVPYEVTCHGPQQNAQLRTFRVPMQEWSRRPAARGDLH